MFLELIFLYLIDILLWNLSPTCIWKFILPKAGDMEGEPVEDPEGDGTGLWGDTTGWGGVVGFLRPGVMLPPLLDSVDKSSDPLAS